MSIKRGNNSDRKYEPLGNEAFDQKMQIHTIRSNDMTTGLIPTRHTRCKSTYPTIYWRGCQPEKIVLDLSIHSRSIKPGTTFQGEIARELKGLLRCLFSDAQMLLVEPLPHGFSNARVVKVQPFYIEGGAGQHVVVKFGDTQTIEQEYKCYLKYVQHFIGDGRSTTILDYQCTMHLGGIVYSFLGTTTQQMQSFGTFYHQAPIDDIKRTLDLLFRSTSRIWYANHNSLRFLNLTEDYQKQSSYTLQQLQDSLGERLPEIIDQETLVFQSFRSEQTKTFLNPFHTLKALQQQIYPTYTSITHGDFNQRNILVDQTGYPWLIDFQSTRTSHILRDVATLDTVIRLQLLTSEQATLDERLVLEEALCAITNFNQLEQLKKSYPPANPVLAKAWETTIHLRKIAYWLVEMKPSNEMDEYYAALLYITMNTLSFSSLEIEQREHALISACLLIDVLKERQFVDAGIPRR